ncbi:MAG: excinuclease ABC subunit UvrA, partial [Candidatus Heimdallarchaeota archaeon]
MKCKGLGKTIEFDPDLLVNDKNLSLAEGALADYDLNTKRFRVSNMRINHIEAIANNLGFTINTPLKDLTEQQWNDFFYGPKKEITVEYDFSWENKQRNGRGQGRARMKFNGLLARMKLRYEKTSSQYIRDFIQEYTRPVPCPTCSGSGLRRESLAVSFKGKNIAGVARMSISSCIAFFNSVKLNKSEKEISEGLLKEIKIRLRFLDDVGLPYL